MRAVPASTSELLDHFKQPGARCMILCEALIRKIKRSVPGLCRAGPKRLRRKQRRSRRRIIAAMSYQSDGVGNGQAGAATSAAAGENLTAILGGHTGTEAVHLRALTLLGLISSDRGSHNYTLLNDPFRWKR